MDDLARDPRSLHLYVRRLLEKKARRGNQAKSTPAATSQPSNLPIPQPSNLLLVVDQFEELFTLCRNETERRAFVDNLLTAAGITVVKDESRSQKDENTSPNLPVFQPSS